MSNAIRKAMCNLIIKRRDQRGTKGNSYCNDLFDGHSSQYRAVRLLGVRMYESW